MRKKLSVLTVCLFAAAMLLSGCSGSDVTISVQSVGMITGLGSIGMYDTFAGVVESGETVNVEKDDTMEIDEIRISVGDSVSVGQVLFTYNTEAIALELEKQELELEQLQNTILTKNAQIASLQNEKNIAASEAQLDYTLRIQSLQVEVKEAEINVSSKEKEISRTRATLDHTEVFSTVTGTVKSINTTGATDPYTGMPLPFITITQTGAYRVKGIINEQNAASLSQGTEVLVRSRVGNQTWTGMISMVDFEHPEQSNNDYFYYGSNDEMTTSTNYPFYIELDNDADLMLGQHVYIEPDLGQDEQSGFWLPASFIVDVNTSRPYVWAAGRGDKLEKRSVKVGDFDADLNSCLILDGLSASDYIADPSEDCREGANVEYYDEESFAGGGMDFDGAVYDENIDFYDDVDEIGTYGGIDTMMPTDDNYVADLDDIFPDGVPEG